MPMALTSLVMKVFSGLLSRVEGLLDPLQFAYRTLHSTFSISTLMEKK